MKEDELISTESGKFGVKGINLEKAWRNTQRSCTELKFTIPAKKKIPKNMLHFKNWKGKEEQLKGRSCSQLWDRTELDTSFLTLKKFTPT